MTAAADLPYVVRCFVAIRATYAVMEMSVTGRAQALYAALHLAEHYRAVAVVDPSGQLIERFGAVPGEG